MRIYLLKNPEKNGRTLVLHFGLGQIGSAIFDRLYKSGHVLKQLYVPMTWKEVDLTEFFQMLKQTMHEFAPFPIGRCLVIWSAGKTDFLSNKQDTMKEFSMFRHCLRSTSTLLIEQYGVQPDLFLMGSAGGLHAGQQYVEDPLHLLAINEYGRQKLREEEFVREAGLFGRVSIFRISTVYTDSARHAHRGIVSTLLINGVRGATTQLYGRPGTLRDYVYAGDLARFVVDQIFHMFSAPVVQYVVSTRPISIFQLQAIAERILRRRLYVTYQTDQRNMASVFFAPSMKPSGLYVSDIGTQMTVLAHRLAGTHLMGHA